jgi:hypothetical protein
VLAGFSLPGCSEFEWWLTCKQEEYHRQAVEALNRLVCHYDQVGLVNQSILWLQRAIELEPWSEGAALQENDLAG